MKLSKIWQENKNSGKQFLIKSDQEKRMIIHGLQSINTLYRVRHGKLGPNFMHNKWILAREIPTKAFWQLRKSSGPIKAQLAISYLMA